MFQLFKAVPITWLMLFVSGLLWAVDNGLSQRLQIEYAAAQEALGAASQFGLWSGAWWKILATALHHGNVIHLLMNTSCLWWLGRLLETRLGSWRYALFCLSAIAVSGVCQVFTGPYVGLSGMLFAQFGLIWTWRRTDKWLQDYVKDEHIQSGLIWLFACLPLTWFRIMPVGNVAHFSGIAYGYLVGQVYFGSPRARSWRLHFLVAHCFLVPAFYFVTHPFWDGSYHWRRSDIAVDPVEKRYHLEQAIRLNPELDGPWLNLAYLCASEGKLQEAWDRILHGLQYHPSFQKAIDLAREIWASFPNRQQQEAARMRLRQIFGDAAPTWEKTLLGQNPLDEVAPPNRTQKNTPNPQPRDDDPDPPQISLPPFTLPRRALDEIPRPPRKLPAPNPDAPGSAEEGRST